MDSLSLKLGDGPHERSHSFFIKHINLCECLLEILLLIDHIFGLLIAPCFFHKISDLLVNFLCLSQNDLSVSVVSIFLKLPLLRMVVIQETLFFHLSFDVGVDGWCFDRSDGSVLAKLRCKFVMVHVGWEILQNDSPRFESFSFYIFECFDFKKLVVHPLFKQSTSNRLNPLFVGELYHDITNLVPIDFVLSSDSVVHMNIT